MINKKNLLSDLKNLVKNGPKENEPLEEKTSLDLFRSTFQPTIKDKRGFLKQEHPNEDLSNVLKNQDVWKPKTSMEDIAHKVMVESVNGAQSKNAFRLNIETLVLDKIHAKFKITRGNTPAFVELLYPNANKKITVKVEVDGAEDRVIEVGLEDENYTRGFGPFIIKNVDEMMNEVRSSSASMDDLGDVNGVTSRTDTPIETAVTGFSPLWENAIARVEASEQEEDPLEKTSFDHGLNASSEGDETLPDMPGLPSDKIGSQEEKAADGFGPSDFTADGGESGGSVDMGAFGDASPASDPAASINSEDPNQQKGVASGSDSFMQFRDKTDWLNDSLNGMQKLIAEDVSKKTQTGSGVVMTQDEILNGTVGIKGDSNHDIIDKFLKIYPELDGIDIPKDMLDQIEDKLAKNDGQFDSFLQAKLPEITGSEDVDDALSTGMFNDFVDMGGEQPSETPEQQDTSLSSFLSDIAPSEEEGVSPEEKEAELEVGGKELNPFPNLSETSPENKEQVEEKASSEKENKTPNK